MAATERAYVYAKERILDGRFAGGDLITEREVAEPNQLSRTPVREAFLQLEAEGLLRLYPKRGALVVPVSVSEVEHVMETRQLIERFAIERVMDRKADIGAALEDSIGRQRALLPDGDPGLFVELDREFHRIFMAAGGNTILLGLLDSLRDRQHRMGITAIARRADRMQTIVAEHEALSAAVRAGRQQQARDLLARHLDGTLRALRGTESDSARTH